MEDAGTGKMTSGETLHPCPRPATATALAAAANHLEPETSHLVHETTDAVDCCSGRHDNSASPAQHVRSQRAVSPSGRCIRFRSFALIACKVARMRLAIE